MPALRVDLDVAIATREAELAELYQCRLERDHADLLFAIVQVTDTWFTARELIGMAPLIPSLSATLTRLSPKSCGRLLRSITDAQDQSGRIPAVRLIRQERSTAGALWKIEIAPRSCDTHGTGR